MNTRSASSPLVALLMGSISDWPILKEAANTLRAFNVPFEARVLSAHRTPEEAAAFARAAEARGLQVLIAAAGGAAHLAGALAAHSTLPVLGIPLSGTPLQGQDALLATLQMPPGIPVGTLAIGAGRHQRRVARRANPRAPRRGFAAAFARSPNRHENQGAGSERPTATGTRGAGGITDRDVDRFPWRSGRETRSIPATCVPGFLPRAPGWPCLCSTSSPAL